MKRNNITNEKLSKQILIMFSDIMCLSVASFFALWLRFEFEISELNVQELTFFKNVALGLPLAAVAMVVLFAAFGIYNILWEFAGEKEMFRAILAIASTCAVHTLMQFVLGLNVPRSFIVLQFVFLLMFIFIGRYYKRFSEKLWQYRRKSNGSARRTMIIGAGDAGAVILQELQRSRFSQSEVVCLLDDDPSKIGRNMHGAVVAGSTADVVEVAKKYKIEEIIFAIPTISAQKKRDILNNCAKTGCSLKTLPGIYQLVNGEVNIQKIRKVEIDDLLERDSIKVNMDEIADYVSGKVVLVTGGGGSIGSELCRQIAEHTPKKLIIFDIYENSAYSIQQELHRKYPELELIVLIGSVRDKKRVDAVFDTYNPEIVYHAAAHKHVPLMEDSPNESIKNNVFGTWNVADAANKYKTDAFILISTDKAVNPTNIMGASKRLCEMIICDFAGRSDTKFACVRFGNVLGSNGSVIPLFKKQIEQGGPVTVTHKDIIRYFMTIPEAVSLVLQAGAYADNGEIFVLDMGNPVRIDDLARNMIRLSGFEPDVDIKIEYTGLRPGEKLYEELLLSGEGLEKTPNDLIFIGRLEEVDSKAFESSLVALKKACDNNSSQIKELVRSIVPEYKERAIHS